MFLRRYQRMRAGKAHRYFALVENLRTENGPRQRIVCYLGELNADAERKWQRTVVFHNRQGDERQLRLFADDAVDLPDDPDVVRVRLKEVGWSNGRSFGDVYLGHWLWRKLGLDEITQRHLAVGRHTVRPADVVAIEVINRLCAPCSEFALAEHWYASTGLEDILGVADGEVTKDRLYRTLDQLLAAKEPIENDLQKSLGTMFDLDYDLLLYDLTSSYFEGQCEENELAKRGYSRDHRGDCKQVVVAMMVTRDGFPMAHHTYRGNLRDVEALKSVVDDFERRFGKSQRIWVLDRGFASAENLAYLAAAGRRYLVGAKRADLKRFDDELRAGDGWQTIRDTVEIKQVQRDDRAYLLARSLPRRRKERAIRKRQLLGLVAALRQFRKTQQQRLAAARARATDKAAAAQKTGAAADAAPPRGKPAKSRTAPKTAGGGRGDADSVSLLWQRFGRLRERFPKAARFCQFNCDADGVPAWSWKRAALVAALARDGAYLLESNRTDMAAADFWQCYMQLTAAEAAFRTLKSELLIRPIWHQYAERTQAHVMVCYLAYALWRTLAELADQAGLMTEIHKPAAQPDAVAPKPRPMSPATILRELSRIQIGDILLKTTAGQELSLRRVARPTAEQARILAALKLDLPERLNPDRML